jgi:hypothetical protein
VQKSGEQENNLTMKKVREKWFLKNKPPDKEVERWLISFWLFELFWRRTIPPDKEKQGGEVGNGKYFFRRLFNDTVVSGIPEAETEDEKKRDSLIDWMREIITGTFKTIKVGCKCTKRPEVHESNGICSILEAKKVGDGDNNGYGQRNSEVSTLLRDPRR